MMKTASVSSLKGGVGKTTTTLNLSVALKALGQRVLVIDADPQGNLTGSLVPQRAEHKQSLSQLIHCVVEDMDCTPDMFINYVADGPDIIASSKILAAANSLLGTVSDSDTVLRRAIAAMTNNGADYDLVLIDCAPALDLLAVTALNASDGLIIPTEPADYSISGIMGVVETVSRIQRATNPRLNIEMVIVNKFDTRKKSHHSIANDIMETFESVAWPTPIPMLREVEDSAVNYTAMQRDKHSKAWPIYMAIAEVIAHGRT